MNKYRIVLWDVLGTGMSYLSDTADENTIEIVDTISTDPLQEGIDIRDIMKYEAYWDYLFIMSIKLSQIESIISKLRIPRNKVIYLMEPDDIYANRMVVYQIFGKNIDRYVGYGIGCNQNRYVMSTVDNLMFMGHSSDKTIMRYMVSVNNVWSKEGMHEFFKLSQKYYSFSDQQKVFCDVGANIGTTALYFKKKIDADIKIFAVEAVKRNYDLLRVNNILNQAGDDNIIIHAGISDKEEVLKIAFDSFNPGGSAMGKNDGDIESVQCMPFNRLLETNHISQEEIKYLWVDLEGYEYQFLKGASDLLKSINVPIQIEITPSKLIENGVAEECYLLLQDIYSKYIMMSDAEKVVHPISELREWIDKNHDQEDLFLLK